MRHFAACASLQVNTLNINDMEKQMLEIPVLQKSKGVQKESVLQASSCCAQPADGAACCTPGTSAEENEDACCEQPSDGSACCNK